MNKFLIIIMFLFSISLGNTPSLYAQKGIEAYEAGNYILADEYFQRSLKEAKIKSFPDMIGKALLNLISLEMESENFLNVKYLISEFPVIESGDLRFQKQWKKSQYYHLVGQRDSSLRILTELKNNCSNKEICQALHADWLKVRVHSNNDVPNLSEVDKFSEEVKSDFLKAEIKNGIGGVLAIRLNSHDAARKRLNELAGFYQEKNLYFRMARCFYFQALLEIKLENESAARSKIKQAVQVFESLGLKNHILKTVLLNLYLFKNQTEGEEFKEHLEKSNLDISTLDLKLYLSELQKIAKLQIPNNIHTLFIR